jgi:hypothetical protein
MKKLLKYSIFVFIAVTVFANIFIFLKGLALGDQIGDYEKKLSTLKQENIVLEQQVYQAQSYSYAASLADTMNYTKTSEPIYIDNLVIAKNY